MVSLLGAAFAEDGSKANLPAAVAPVLAANQYQQKNLVSNLPGKADKTDPNLVNPWGLSRSSGSPWWAADNGTGLSTLYSADGTIASLVVKIPHPTRTFHPPAHPQAQSLMEVPNSSRDR